MAGSNRKVQTANRIWVSVGGSPLGLGQSVELHDDYQMEALQGIGDIHPQEFVPSAAVLTVTISEMVMLDSSMRASGASYTSPDDALRGVSHDIIVSSKDGGMLRKYTGCFYTSGDVQVRKHAIVIANAIFKCMDASGAGA